MARLGVGRRANRQGRATPPPQKKRKIRKKIRLTESPKRLGRAMSRPRQHIARMPFRVAVALIVLWVALSPQAPETNAQSTIAVDFDRIVLFDRGGSFLFYRDYNVQEGTTLRPIIKFSAATPADATFSVVAEAGTATATVDFPAGIHTFKVPAGSIQHSFEIPIPWDAEIEDYETFIRNRPDDHPWHPDIEKYADTFRVLGCTSTEQGAAAWRTATGVTIQSQHPNLPGHTPFTTPIYWVNGVRVAPHYNNFWTGAWGNANSHANQRNADGKAAAITQGTNGGCLDWNDNKVLNQQVAGTRHLSKYLGSNIVTYGNDGPAPDIWKSAIYLRSHSKSNLVPDFGISAVYEVGEFQTADPVVSIRGLGRFEEGGDAVFTVEASVAPTSDLTIKLNVRESTVGGANYVANGQEGDRTIVIRAGQRSAKFTISTTGHHRIDPDGRVIASILPGSGYAAADHSNPNLRSWHGTSVSNDNNVIQMRSETRRVAEWGYTASVIVEVGDGLALHGTSRSINYTTAGTADRGSGKDYTIDGCTGSTCSVTLSANRHSAWITIRLNDDGIDEEDETFIITLQDGNGYTVNLDRNVTTVTIPDNDTRGLYFSRSWADVDEGSSHTYTVKLRSQPTAAVTVNIVSDNPDVTVNPTSLTFNPSGSNLWSRAQTVTIDAAQDSDTVDDTAILTHTTSGGDYGGANALRIGRQVSVEDDDTATVTPVTQLPVITVTGGAAVTEGSPASVTVNANPAPTSSLTVNVDVMETPGQDFVAAGQERVWTVSLNAGATSTTFFVPTVNDNTDEDDGYIHAFVNDGTGYVAGGGSMVTIRDNDYHTPAVTFSAESGGQREDDGIHEARVDLTHPAPPGGITLLYNVSGTATRGNSADYTVPNTVTVNAGERSAAIPVAINDDSSFEEDTETVILTLSSSTGYRMVNRNEFWLTILDDDNTSGRPVLTVCYYRDESRCDSSVYNRSVYEGVQLYVGVSRHDAALADRVKVKIQYTGVLPHRRF